MARLGTMARIGLAHLTWKRYLQEGMTRLGITLKQYHVLRQLERRRFLYPSDIARELFCDRPTATVVVNNLEREGWVERAPDPDDGRRVRVLLATAGRKKLTEVRRSPEMKQRRQFDPLAGLNADEREQLNELLGKLNRNLAPLRERQGHGDSKTQEVKK
jgi:DNA-binding MarR family transcriptional regulator